MALPITYNYRNIFVRWRATLATVMGIGLVVAVYVLVQALAGAWKNPPATPAMPAIS